jgi:hypothetical protein
MVCRSVFPLRSHHVVYLAVSPLEARTALHNAAVGENGRSCNVAGAVSGEEGNNGGDLFWSRHPAQRDDEDALTRAFVSLAFATQ